MMAMQNWQKLVVEIFSQSWAIAPTLQQGVDKHRNMFQKFWKNCISKFVAKWCCYQRGTLENFYRAAQPFIPVCNKGKRWFNSAQIWLFTVSLCIVFMLAPAPPRTFWRKFIIAVFPYTTSVTGCYRGIRSSGTSSPRRLPLCKISFLSWPPLLS